MIVGTFIKKVPHIYINIQRGKNEKKKESTESGEGEKRTT